MIASMRLFDFVVFSVCNSIKWVFIYHGKIGRTSVVNIVCSLMLKIQIWWNLFSNPSQKV